MPVVEVIGVPEDKNLSVHDNDAKLDDLDGKITGAILSSPSLELKNETDVTCIIWKKGDARIRRSEIIVRIGNLTKKTRRTPKTLQLLVEQVARVVQDFYPEYVVECTTSSTDEAEGVCILQPRGK